MSTVEKEHGTRAVAETLSSSPVNRKRSRSSDSETEDALSVKKKTSLLNGEEIGDVVSKDSLATTEVKEQSTPERVVILDAGAQYGKVLNYVKYILEARDDKCFYTDCMCAGDRSSNS